MHKIHIIQRQDGSVLVVAVLNPGTPQDVAHRISERLKMSLDKGDKVLVVPYATAAVVSNETLWQSVKSWWATRRLKERLAWPLVSGNGSKQSKPLSSTSSPARRDGASWPANNSRKTTTGAHGGSASR